MSVKRLVKPSRSTLRETPAWTPRKPRGDSRLSQPPMLYMRWCAAEPAGGSGISRARDEMIDIILQDRINCVI